MSAYVDIGGSWKDVKSISANIGGSWRNVTEGYQLRGGVWEQVWPGYTNYGNGFDALADFYYAGYCSTYTGDRVYTMNGNTVNVRGHGSQRGNLYWYVLSPIDFRGYNYIAMTVRVGITDDSSTLYLDRTLYLRPIIATSYYPDDIIRDDDVVYGTEISPTVEYDRVYSPITFIDVSNYEGQDKYLKIGYQVGTSVDSQSFDVYSYLTRSSDNGYGVFLYKNKSDCTLNEDDYWRSFSMSYSG